MRGSVQMTVAISTKWVMMILAHRAPLLEDKCQTAPLYVSMYILFNVTYNILVIMILKFGSANMMFLGSTALVPLTNALFCLHFIPGHKPMQMTDFLGLIVIMAGITTYRFLGGGKQEVDGKGYAKHKSICYRRVSGFTSIGLLDK